MRTRWTTGGGLGPSFALMSDFRRQMDQIFDDLSGATTPGSFVRRNAAQTWPRIAASESEDGYLIRAEVPGVRPEDVELSIVEGQLRLGIRRREEHPEGYRMHRRERAAFELRRRFEFAKKVDAEAAAASLENGILSIRVPKLAEAKPRTIPVEIG